MEEAIHYRVILKSQGMKFSSGDLEAVANYCSTVFSLSNVSCSRVGNELRLVAEDTGSCDWDQLICDVRELLAGSGRPHVGIISVTPLVRRVANGKSLPG